MKEIKCPKCGSKNIKEAEDFEDFLPYKDPNTSEKDVINAKPKTKQRWFCWDCENRWETDIF